MATVRNSPSRRVLFPGERPRQWVKGLARIEIR
jgi:hypothetical protein